MLLLSLSPLHPIRSVGPWDRHGIIAPCNPNTLYFFSKKSFHDFLIFLYVSYNNNENRHRTAFLNMPTSPQSSKLLLNTFSFIKKVIKVRLALKGLLLEFHPLQICKLYLSFYFFSLLCPFGSITSLSKFLVISISLTIPYLQELHAL